MLLSGFLELDISFQCLDELVARRAHWRVAWDRTGRIADVMEASWKANPGLDDTAIFRQYMESTWYYVNQVGLSIARGYLWRATNALAVIRTRVIELAGLRHGYDTRRFREVDNLPPALLTALEKTLVQQVDPTEILRALRMVVELFISEAQALATARGIDAPPVPKAILVALLDVWETQVQQTTEKSPKD